MKKSTLTACMALLLLVLLSCGKSKNTPYARQITGVNLRDIMAVPTGSLGNPDVNAEDDNFGMAIFPTPCSNLMEVYVHASGSTSEAVTATLVPVIYKDAPKTWEDPNRNTVDVNIENTDAAGTVVMTYTQNLVPPDTGQSGAPTLVSTTLFHMDVTNLPQGFYRVYVSTGDGKQIWDNGWVLR